MDVFEDYSLLRWLCIIWERFRRSKLIISSLDFVRYVGEYSWKVGDENGYSIVEIYFSNEWIEERSKLMYIAIGILDFIFGDKSTYF